MLLMTLGLILLLELISNNVIEPWLYGSAPACRRLSIIVGRNLLDGAVGADRPDSVHTFTVCLLVLGRYIPSLQIHGGAAGQRACAGPHRLYQRLLADDVEDAVTWPYSPSRRVRTLQSSQHGPARLPTAPRRCRASMTEAAFPRCVWSTATMPSRPAEHRLRLSNGMDELLEELYEASAARRHAQRPGALWEHAGTWTPWPPRWPPTAWRCMAMPPAMPDSR
jgi:hypothetical protein